MAALGGQPYVSTMASGSLSDTLTYTANTDNGMLALDVIVSYISLLLTMRERFHRSLIKQ